MHEQLTIYDCLSPTFKIEKPIRLIETFAGIGSQAKALKNIGANFEHWKVIEFDRCAVNSYNAVHDTHFDPQDIRNIHSEDLQIIDRNNRCYVLTYSFPCQDLSTAGLQKGMRKGSRTRSGLLWEIERILDECGNNLPDVLLMENVAQVIGEKNICDFYKWRHKLETLGYSNYCQILNAKDYGMPQNRERCFMVSILGDWNYTFPQKEALKIKPRDLFEKNVDRKYYLKKINIEALQRQSKKEHKPTILTYDTQYILTITASYGTGLWEQYLLCDKQTSTTKKPERVSHIEDTATIRKFTPRECWRFMGFSDKDFENANAINVDTQLYKQAGNSIVVNVLMAIFQQML